MSATLSQNLAQSRRALSIAFLITVLFLLLEVVGGILTNSLALIADAGHMASDVGALALSFAAAWLAGRPVTHRRTYGYYRAEILAAAANGLTLLAVVGYVTWTASHRFFHPPEVNSAPMLAVAVAGLLANLAAAYVLSRHRGSSLNVRSAFLHVLGDALASVAAVAAGIIMLTSGQFIADPIFSVAIAALILIAAWRLLRESANVLLEATPPGLDIPGIQRVLLEIDGVLGIHDLHVWTVTSSFPALSAHMETDDSYNQHDILVSVRRALAARFGIQHATIQLETHSLHEELEACCGIDMMQKESEHAYFHD
ncbi:MAG: cation diffusion facilitator family transporter [Dehalococcoidia bacterium]